MNKDLEKQKERLNLIAVELEKAREHALIAAKHFATNEVPRASAHSLAIQGHLAAVAELLTEVAKLHAAKAGV